MGKRSNPSKSSKKSISQDRQASPGTLPGWPGYRTRAGRSGFDPVDSRTEAAHTAGTIFQRLFTGQIRNPFHLFLLVLLALVLTLPLVLGISEALNGNPLPWNAWLLLLIAGVAGIFILINFIKNLIRMIVR